MEQMAWSIQTSSPGQVPVVVAEFVLNDVGIFVKRERRVPKKALFSAVTGFRVGYTAIAGTDYRAAPLERNAILWYKVTSVIELNLESLLIRGNRSDEITLCFLPKYRDSILRHIEVMRSQNPTVAAADYAAASWICWRDDDDWGDPSIPLTTMIVEEQEIDRFIETEVLEETVLCDTPDSNFPPQVTKEVTKEQKFCYQCGAKLFPDSQFCEMCGTRLT